MPPRSRYNPLVSRYRLRDEEVRRATASQDALSVSGKGPTTALTTTGLLIPLPGNRCLRYELGIHSQRLANHLRRTAFRDPPIEAEAVRVA